MLPIISTRAASHKSKKAKVTCVTFELIGCVGNCRFQPSIPRVRRRRRRFGNAGRSRTSGFQGSRGRLRFSPPGTDPDALAPFDSRYFPQGSGSNCCTTSATPRGRPRAASSPRRRDDERFRMKTRKCGRLQNPSQSEQRRDWGARPMPEYDETVRVPSPPYRCVCCGVSYSEVDGYPFCDRCFSDRCERCASDAQETILTPRKASETITGRSQGLLRNRNGRPRGPRMPCGWRCGGEFTEHEMRAHFTICPKRPAPPEGGAPLVKVLKNSKAKRGRPPGLRMQCGWRCCAKLTASRMRKHFTACSNRPKP